MKDLWTVASFTFQDLVKRKSFIISNIIILLIIIIGFNIPRVLEQFSGGDENFGTTKTTIIDYDNIYQYNPLGANVQLGEKEEIWPILKQKLKEE